MRGLGECAIKEDVPGTCCSPAPAVPNRKILTVRTGQKRMHDLISADDCAPALLKEMLDEEAGPCRCSMWARHKGLHG
jgi:hypothetical protein